jgi:hypothetical protein
VLAQPLLSQQQPEHVAGSAPLDQLFVSDRAPPEEVPRQLQTALAKLLIKFIIYLFVCLYLFVFANVLCFDMTMERYFIFGQYTQKREKTKVKIIKYLRCV